jgi:uncharacterized membrane protein YhaH (DUF805 family)
MQTFFNPMGRIGPDAFRNAALILIAISAAIALLPLVAPQLAMFTFASLALLYPWAVIWVKRLHDAGKSGKLFLAILAAWWVVSAIASWFISSQFGTPIVPPTDPADRANFSVVAAMTEQMVAVALPAMIANAVISLVFALLINEQLKSDPQQNAYGAPSA